jgi:hypothetical protein
VLAALLLVGSSLSVWNAALRRQFGLVRHLVVLHHEKHAQRGIVVGFRGILCTRTLCLSRVIDAQHVTRYAMNVARRKRPKCWLLPHANETVIALLLISLVNITLWPCLRLIGSA